MVVGGLSVRIKQLQAVPAWFNEVIRFTPFRQIRSRDLADVSVAKNQRRALCRVLWNTSNLLYRPSESQLTRLSSQWGNRQRWL